MRFIDLFCGIGGFRQGFVKNGFECVFSSDIDSNVQQIYKKNYGEVPFGDITKVIPNEIPDFEVLTAGFPCQPFSISGLKKGFNDTRGTLFFDICRIIKEKQPKVVVLENVKHLIHHDKKNTLRVILDNLVNLGYNVSYKLLNTKDFGLPQNRERIFIIGSKNGTFDFELCNQSSPRPLSDFLDTKGPFEYLKKDEYTILEDELVDRTKPSGLIFVGYRNKNGFKRGIRPGTLHLNRVHRQPNRIYSVEGNHPTLPSQEPSGRFFIYLPKLDKVRKLTVKECYKIMGFNDDFKMSNKISAKYNQIGNSVAVNITQEISHQILNQGLLNCEPQRKVIGDLFSMY
jgi:DNA (cytosine-5)-methyltransferase 1